MYFLLLKNSMKQKFYTTSMGTKVILAAAYAYYSQDYYGDVIAELERFLEFIKHKNKDYAYYLLAISYYEQIVDKQTFRFNFEARNYFNIIVRDFPIRNMLWMQNLN